MKQFDQFSLNPETLRAISAIGYTDPTPIQQKCIPLILEGKDILASAQTGTGKTAAFLIPIITHMLTNDDRYAIVLTPTRELADQIMKEATKLLAYSKKLRIGLFIGGKPIHKQISHLKSNPRLIIGTPGRINDLIERKVMDLRSIDYLVLDETDRMLDMGFEVQIREIIKIIPKTAQRMLFSATIPSLIEKLSAKYLHDPVRIAIGQTSKPAENIVQEAHFVKDPLKYDQLISEVKKIDGTIIIFTKTKRTADRLANKLYKDQYDARAIHGDLRQNQRERVLQLFKQGKCKILVATDVAARGLDIKNVSVVVNYDIPTVAEDYIHRIGRTARAGAKGIAINLIAPKDENLWKNIQKYLATGDSSSAPSRSQKRGTRSKKRRSYLSQQKQYKTYSKNKSADSKPRKDSSRKDVKTSTGSKSTQKNTSNPTKKKSFKKTSKSKPTSRQNTKPSSQKFKPKKKTGQKSKIPQKF